MQIKQSRIPGEGQIIDGVIRLRIIDGIIRQKISRAN
jgi:hypothetical protein